MTNKGIFVVLGLFISLAANAQNAYDAERVLGNELNGTARFVGMGGAMGALGGDMSVMGVNPAGIGIYRSNDFSVSFGFNNTETKSKFNGVSMSEDRTRASLDQVGFVYSYKIGNRTSLRFVNFGFNYHKSKNFNRLFSMGGGLDGFSQTKQLANDFNYFNEGMPSGLQIVDANDYFNKFINAESSQYLKNPYEEYWNQVPVLSVMGAAASVVDWPEGFNEFVGWDGDSNNFYSQETGGIDQYDFNVSFNVEDRVYFGATLGIYDINYKRYTSYTENLNDDFGASNGGYTLDNYYMLDGSGVDLKLGVIVRPIEDSPFRIGLAVHTPTWYELRESSDAVISSEIACYDFSYKDVLSDYLGPDYLTYDYNLMTPWKFNVSMGTTLQGILALGAEYEYQDYSSTKLKDIGGYELGGQSSVEENLKGVHTFRAGMEARLASSFSMRAGYNYTSAAFEDDAYALLDLYRTNTDYNNKKAVNTITFGVGYRGNAFYTDLAYKCDLYKSDFYAFDDIDLPVTKVDNARHQLLLTLGVRF